ncbi:MAG: arsenate reductase [Glaciecola sp.]|jgi:arsenate reductase
MRILKDLNLTSDFILQDIKEEPLTAQQLEELHKLSGNYEALFSKRAKLYKEMDLKNANLQERDFKHYILDHYTFLKRPVIVVDSSIFIGNSKKIVEAALQNIY